MQTPAEENKMDYDELTLNPVLAEIEAETTGDSDPKNKTRRYWTPKEEERFYEIWGRENWRLTRHGKNTVFFAMWSDEMKSRFGIDVKSEEIQAKVNQTRAKFRQVKKTMAKDKNAVRWKKFEIIDKILKNQFRPSGASPVPEEALKRNRDIDADEVDIVPRQPTPTSITSNSTQDALNSNSAERAPDNEQHLNVAPNMTNSTTLPEHNMSGGLFNTSNDSRANYSSELFSDHLDEIKQEYDEVPATEIKREEFPADYHNFSTYDGQPQTPQQTTHHYATPTTATTVASTGAAVVAAVAATVAEGINGVGVNDVQGGEQLQLHQLQTPQQQQLQQQYQQHQQQYQTPLMQPQPSAPAVYDHSTNSYVNSHANQNHYGAPTPPPPPAPVVYNNVAPLHQPQPPYNNNYMGNAPMPTAMQPPRPATPATPQRRRRGPAANSIHAVAAASTLAADSLEAMYMEEVRKKNKILEEQTEIARKRLQLDERRLKLMEQYFPTYAQLGTQILQTLNGGGRAELSVDSGNIAVNNGNSMDVAESDLTEAGATVTDNGMSASHEPAQDSQNCASNITYAASSSNNCSEDAASGATVSSSNISATCGTLLVGSSVDSGNDGSNSAFGSGNAET